MTEQELLAVLDMGEDEQWKWIAEQWQELSIDPSWSSREFQNMALADLAFRLRDEAVCEYENQLIEACWLVYRHITGAKDKLLTSHWFHYTAQPIHWIIGALIAKELNND